MRNNLPGRIPPQAIDAEQAALGAMLLEREAILRAKGLLQPEDFYRDAHRWIYRGILDLHERKEPVDLVTLGEWLKSHAAGGKATDDNNLLNQIGGALYLTDCMQQTPTAAGIGNYARIVLEKSRQRQVIAVADALMEGAYTGEQDVDELIRAKSGALVQIGLAGKRRERMGIGEAAYRSYERLYKSARGKVEQGFLTGWRGVNQMLRPFKSGQLVVIAADTGCGKTAFATNLSIDLAEAGKHGLIFSLEMEGEELGVRAMMEKLPAAVTQDTFDGIHEAEEIESEKTLELVYDAMNRLWDLPLRIEDTADMTVGQIEEAIQWEINEHGPLDFVVIDYLQLITVESKRDRYLEVGNISKALKRMAKEYRLTIFALCQLGTKKLAERKPRRPMLEDLYESGKIGQDADTVIMLYWPARYGKMEMLAAKYDPKNALHKCVVEISVPKGRAGTKQGAYSSMKMFYHGAHYSFRDLSSEEWKALKQGGQVNDGE